MAKAKRPTKPKKSRINLTDYDSDEFLVPASDDHGHAARCNTRYPTTFEREIQVIVASRQFPFQEESDVIRWCLAEGLRALNRMEEIPNSVMAQAEMVIESARTVLYHAQFERTFTVLGQGFTVLREAGAIEEIRQLYARVRSQIDAMPPGFWRNHYTAKLRNQWGHLVGDTVKPLPLGPGPTLVPDLEPATGTHDVAIPAPPKRRRAGLTPVDE